MNDSCCSGALNVTIFKNSEIVNFAVNFTNTTSGETEIIVNECAKPLQTNNYILQLTNDQMSKNISFNYTSPSIDNYLVTIDSYTVDVYNITTASFEVTFPLLQTQSKLVPYMYTASLLHENAVDTRQHLTCDDVHCRTGFEGLMFSTRFAVDIVSSTEFAGVTFNTSSDQLDLTTLNCSGMLSIILYCRFLTGVTWQKVTGHNLKYHEFLQPGFMITVVIVAAVVFT